MTKQRRDDKSTEFGIWLRQQPAIDSSFGYVATNIDYLWRYKHSKKWLLIEEKRFGYLPNPGQVKLYELIDQVKLVDKNYMGFHVLVFEKTNPNDGRIWLDGKYISKNDLMIFLLFAKSPDWYQSYFPDKRICRIFTKSTIKTGDIQPTGG